MSQELREAIMQKSKRELIMQKIPVDKFIEKYHVDNPDVIETLKEFPVLIFIRFYYRYRTRNKYTAGWNCTPVLVGKGRVRDVWAVKSRGCHAMERNI